MADEVKFVASEADYVAANRAWYVASPIRRWLLWATFAIPLFVAGDYILDVLNGLSPLEAFADSAWLLAAAIALIAVNILIPMLTRSNVRRMMAQNKALRSEVRCCWDTRAVQFFGTNGNADLVWSDLHRWLYDENSFVFLPSDKMMLLLPTRVLSRDQIADLRAIALRFGPPPG